MTRPVRVLTATLVIAAALTQVSVAQGKISNERAQKLEKDLGAKSAGIYYDKEEDNIVVTVTDEASAKRARAAGAVARIVPRSRAKLDAANVGLRKKVKTPGTSWGIDPVENKVVFTFDASVDAAKRGKIRDILKSYGDAVRAESVTGTLQPTWAGGDAVYGGAGRCSLGFNVHYQGRWHYLTAGHCVESIRSWHYPGSETVAFGWPYDDFALMRYTWLIPIGMTDGVNGPGGFQEIKIWADAIVGDSVTRSGSTTGVRTGRVQAVNQTANYAGGKTVYGLVRASTCSEQGDSGGPFFYGTVAYGLLSGGWGSCSVPGGSSVYQPVGEALARYGLSLP